MNNPLNLDAIKKRADAATAGPWTATAEGQIDAVGPEQYRGGGLGMYRPTIDIGGGNWGGEGGGYYMDAADAEFIAHARTDVPALVAEVERLRDENAAAFIGGVNALEEELVRQDRFTEATLRIAAEVRGSQTEGADRG